MLFKSEFEINVKSFPSPTQFQLLCLLAPADLTGRGLGQEHKNETGEAIPIGTLYTTLRRMVKLGWISSEAHGEDARACTFRLTPRGREYLYEAGALYLDLARLAEMKGGFALDDLLKTMSAR
jgi:DNA-binding PadR family transcriptional regulator